MGGEDACWGKVALRAENALIETPSSSRADFELAGVSIRETLLMDNEVPPTGLGRVGSVAQR